MMSVTTTLRARGQVTIPHSIRTALHLRENDSLEVELTQDGILLRPRRGTVPSQEWFWTPEWQEGERRASEQIAAGQTIGPMSEEEFLAALDRWAGEHADI